MNTKVVCQLLSLVLISAGLLFTQPAYSSPKKVTYNNVVKNKIQKHKLIIKIPENLGIPKIRVGEAVR
jgi:hypothetical protein